MIVETIKIKEMGMFSELFIGISIIYLIIYGTFLSFNKRNKFPLLHNSMLYLGVLVLSMTCFLLVNDNLNVLNYLSFSNSIANDYVSFVSKILIGLASFICLLMIQQYIADQKINHFEYTLVLLFAILGLFLLCSANDLITAYLAIELQSLAFYILSAFKKKSTFSIEAGLKYFILGAFSSGLLLFGASLIYGVTGSINFEDFKELFFWFFSGSGLIIQKLNDHKDLNIWFDRHFYAKDINIGELSTNFDYEEQLIRLKIIYNKLVHMSVYSFQLNERDLETLYYQYLYYFEAPNYANPYILEYRELMEKIYSKLESIGRQRHFILFYDSAKNFLENPNDVSQYCKNYIAANQSDNLDNIKGKFKNDFNLSSVESQWDSELHRLEQQHVKIEKDRFEGCSSKWRYYEYLLYDMYLLQGGLENNPDFITGIKYLVKNISERDLIFFDIALGIDKTIIVLSDDYKKNYKFIEIFDLINRYCARPGIDEKLEFFKKNDYQIKNYFYDPFNTSLLQFAVIFILISLFFKLALAPFHLWSPDIYEGSPTSSTFFFAVVPKIGIFILLLRICYFGFYGFIDSWRYLIVVIGMLSVLIGSFVGLEQRKLKSLLAYSSISHMGYLLISFSTGTIEGVQMLFSYLVIYMVSGLCIWSILVLTRLKNNYLKKQNKDLADLTLLSKSNKMLAIILSIALLSIAGLPPMIGFIVKFGIFLVSIETSMYFVALFSILFSVISTFFYIRIVKILYFEKSLIGKLYYPITTNKVFFVNLFFYFLLFLFVNPTLIYLFSYKFSLLLC
jgi:NADH:ubiquinone oxidoreductase subunit 2 (subunit N)